MMNVFYRAGDELWFLGFYSNNFEDNEGEILSKAAHEEYAAWLKGTGIHPPITVLHQPQFNKALHIMHYLGLVRGEITPEEFEDNLRTLYKPYAIAEAKAVIPVDGFNLVIGKVYDNKRALVEKIHGWEMSHGFLVLQHSSDEKVIEKYRSFEFTICPPPLATNRATLAGFLRKDTTMDTVLKGMSEEDRQTLSALLNDQIDPADVEEAVQRSKAILSKLLGSKGEHMMEEDGEEKKEMMDDKEEEEKEKAVTEEKAVTVALDASALTEVVEKMTSAFEAVATRINAFETAVNTRLDKQDQQLEALKATEDEKIAAAFSVPDWSLGFASVTQKSAPKEEDKELLEDLKKEIKPEVDEKARQNDPTWLGLGSLFNS